jgi:adenylyltransferase/sulfurtransferase
VKARARALVIGAGGLGCAAGLALARSGLELSLTILDPDRVELGNVHRQVLFGDGDVGMETAPLAARRIAALSAGRIEARGIALELDAKNALGLFREHQLVLEGCDRSEVKFLAADAAVLAPVPVVQAGVVGLAGWALATVPFEGACLRCVFEDVPTGAVATCAADGVLGPAVGTVGAIAADLAAHVLGGGGGALVRWDARGSSGRASRVARRRTCPLCGDEDRAIRDLSEERYLRPGCA